MSAPGSLPRTWLELLIDAVELGGWRFALQVGPAPPDAPPEQARLVTVLRLVALSMLAQADADLDGARELLDQAAHGLPVIARRVSRQREWQAVPLPPPPDRSGLPFSSWRVAIIVFREQQELAELYAVVRERTDARDVLIEAFNCWRMWVDEDPDTWCAGGGDGLRDLDPSPHSLCRRATRLRRAVVPTAPAVDSGVWRRITGYHGLRVSAAHRLAQRELVPWTAEIRVRPARRRVWEAARNSANGSPAGPSRADGSRVG